MRRVPIAILLLVASLATPLVAYGQAATPLPPPPPPPPPPPTDPQTAPTVVPARPPPSSQPPSRTPPARHTQPPAPPPPPPQVYEVEERRSRRSGNLVFLELGGNAIVYSVNYERMFADSSASVRIGAGFAPVGSNQSNRPHANIFSLPVLGNYYVGARDHKLELGAGITFLNVSGTSPTFVSATGFVPAPTGVLGYRYLPSRGGLTFFAGFTPLIIPGGGKPFFPWGGMSLGGAF